MLKLAIIGASYLQKPIVEKAKALGIETHCFAWRNGSVCADVADFFYPINVVEKELILEQCQTIGIDGILTIASDITAPTVAYVANKLCLNGNSYESAVKANNKYLMREAFSSSGILCPRYQMVKEAESAKLEDWCYPLIVKPTDRSGSLGVRKVSNVEELVDAVNNAISFSFKKEAIIEEYIEGREISVEFISFHGKHHPLTITDKVTTGAPHFVELEHHQPAQLPDVMYERIYSITHKALDALYVTSKISFFKRNRLSFYLTVAIVVSLLSGFLYLYPISKRPRVTLIFAFVYVIDLFIIIKERKNRNVVILMAIFILISIFQPFGSDFGIYSMGPYSIWGIVPASMVIVINMLANSHNDGIFNKACIVSIGTIVVFLTLLMMRYNYIHCYGDPGTRSSKTYKIISLSRANVFTSKERAEEIDSIMAICNKYIVEGDTTLFSLDIPTLHYLTNTKPYLTNPWPNTAPIGKLDRKFEYARTKPLPKLIIRRRVEIGSGFTEIERRYQYNDKLVKEFTLSNHYKTVWSNKNYIIYAK